MWARPRDVLIESDVPWSAFPSIPAHKNQKPPCGGFLVFGGGGNRTRVPGREGRASTGLSVLSGCRGRGGGATRFPSRILGYVLRAIQALRGASLGRLRASRPLEAAQSRARRLSTLTRRERGCRCCWHLKFAESGDRRLHLQPAILTAQVETGAPPVLPAHGSYTFNIAG